MEREPGRALAGGPWPQTPLAPCGSPGQVGGHQAGAGFVASCSQLGFIPKNVGLKSP